MKKYFLYCVYSIYLMSIMMPILGMEESSSSESRYSRYGQDNEEATGSSEAHSSSEELSSIGIYSDKYMTKSTSSSESEDYNDYVFSDYLQKSFSLEKNDKRLLKIASGSGHYSNEYIRFNDLENFEKMYGLVSPAGQYRAFEEALDNSTVLLIQQLSPYTTPIAVQVLTINMQKSAAFIPVKFPAKAVKVLKDTKRISRAHFEIWKTQKKKLGLSSCTHY